MKMKLKIVNKEANSEVGLAFWFFTYLIFVAITTTNVFGQTSQVDMFKLFLASPPPIEKLLFKKRDLYQYQFPGAPHTDTNAYQYFVAKRQNTDFVMEEVYSLDDSKALINAFVSVHGKSGFTFWKVIGDNYIYWEDKNSNYCSEYLPVQNLPSNEEILIGVSVARNILLQAINMGIGELRPGTLTWNGNSFTAEDQSHGFLTGDLIVEKGIPMEIRYHRGNTNSNPVVIKYNYSRSETMLPDQFHDEYTNTNGVKTSFSEFTIISLQTAAQTIPSDEFSAKVFMVKGFTKTIQQVGKNLYWKDPSGTMIVIKSKNITKSTPRLFMIVILFVSMLFLLLFIIKHFRNGKTQNTKTYEKKTHE